MQRYNLDYFLNNETKKQNLKKQLQISARSNEVLVRKRNRSPEETRLLIKAMLKDIKRLEEEGVIQKNGRQWKLNF